jgi:hypothetical protein
MIGLPEKGLSASKTKHNSNLEIFCDWIEASALFVGREVSGSDLVDLLIENQIYQSQEFAWEFVNNAFSVIDLRKRLLGAGYPLNATEDGYEHAGDWEDYAPYAFCLMLSFARSHPAWIRANFTADYTDQGALFEELTAEAVRCAFPGWRVHATGWTRTRTVQLKSVVADICALLNEAAGDIIRWTKATAKEAGLDLIAYRPFADNNVGVPVYLWQCASGADWQSKRKTPDIRIWVRVITWAVDPRRAMAMPFAISETEVRQSSVVVAGLLMDRHRLLEAGQLNKEWISPPLLGRLVNWLWPRVAVLPLHEAVS